MELDDILVQELKDGEIQFDELAQQYFVDSTYDNLTGYYRYKFETENILKLLNDNICSFIQIVDRLKSVKDDDNDSCLCRLLRNRELFEELINSRILNNDDLKYLLNKIEDIVDLTELCFSTSVIKGILKEFVMNEETVDRLNIILNEKDKLGWYKDPKIPNVFDLIEFYAINYNKHNKKHEKDIDKEVLKLNNLNKYIYSSDLSSDQKLELFKILKSNEIAQDRLNQIIETHLENNYSFNELMQYLTKVEKKNLVHI